MAVGVMRFRQATNKQTATRLEGVLIISGEVKWMEKSMLIQQPSVKNE